jgi:hypothetical protein
VTLVPTSEAEPLSWRFTTKEPADDWTAADFADGSWQEGPAGFGTTEWNTGDIWLRRTFELTNDAPPRIALRIHHDENADVYLNGVRVAQLRGYTTRYEVREISPAALQKGRNVLAVHCHQTGGGQYIDVGIDAIIPAP